MQTLEYHSVSIQQWQQLIQLVQAKLSLTIDADKGSHSAKGLTIEWCYEATRNLLTLKCLEKPRWLSGEVLQNRFETMDATDGRHLMSSIDKLLQLIPDFWHQTLAQAAEFEGYISKAQSLTDSTKQRSQQWQTQLGQWLTIDWGKLETKLNQNDTLKALAQVQLDLPSLLSLPPDFDIADTQQLKALIQQQATANPPGVVRRDD